VTKDLLSDPRITAAGLLAEASSGLVAKTLPQLSAHGLGPVDFDVLIRLSRSQGQQLRMTDLAAQTGLSTSGVTRVVDRLERDGLVERRACPTDRRGSFTVITKAGEAKLLAALPGHLDLLEKWFTGLFEAPDLEVFLTGLRRLRDVVRPESVSGAA
jgi:DNA-binding MarR family transcriptional regulator